MVSHAAAATTSSSCCDSRNVIQHTGGWLGWPPKFGMCLSQWQHATCDFNLIRQVMNVHVLGGITRSMIRNALTCATDCGLPCSNGSGVVVMMMWTDIAVATAVVMMMVGLRRTNRIITVAVASRHGVYIARTNPGWRWFRSIMSLGRRSHYDMLWYRRQCRFDRHWYGGGSSGVIVDSLGGTAAS